MNRLFKVTENEKIIPDHSTVFTALGASSFGMLDRQENDFYATDPIAVTELLKVEDFAKDIWEPACGMGHIAEALKLAGHNVKCTDLFNYGYGETGIDFLKCTEKFEGDIITNPPFKMGLEFVYQALSLIPSGNRVAMLLRIQFLESTTRRELFDKYPPQYIYIFQVAE